MKKSTLTKVLVVLLCLATAMAFTACGKADSAKKADSKTYIVTTEATFPPFDTTNKKGEFAGLDRDLMDAIAKDQGLTLKYKMTKFDSLIPDIQAGSADIIAAGMNSEDKERREKIDFSKPYYDSGLVVMVKKDNETIKGIDDLTADMKAASQTGTSGAKVVQKLKKDGKIKKAVLLGGFNECVQQLNNGDVNAIIIDKPVAENYMSKQPGKFKAVGKVLNAEAFAFGVKKGNKELLDKINAGLDNIIKSGEFQKICKKWKVDSKY